MFKTFFAIRKSADPVDIELERAMHAMHDRMEKMLGYENAKSNPALPPSHRAGAYQLR
jgi:hypothetical protein